MTTTIMRDSVVGDAWIQASAAACPIQRRVDPITNNFNGDIITGPVRLAYADVFELPKLRQGQTSEPKYGSHLLFTQFADFAILYEEYYRLCGLHFPEYFDAPTGQYHGLQSPFRAQAEKVKSGGYTPGLMFLSTKTKFKPSIVDARMNPIVDRSKVYPGVWAICAINPYPYGKNPPQPKKGVAFGLQSIMIIGDDTNLGAGKAPDPRTQFAGINIQAPVVRPNIGGMPPGGAPAPYGAPNPQQPPANYAPAAPAYPQAGVGPLPGATSAYPSSYGAPPAPLPPGQPQPAPSAGYMPPAAPMAAYGAPTAYPTETEDQRIMREMGLS